MVVAIVIGCSVWTLARTNGILGGAADLEWRWTPTAEELLLAQASNEPPLPSPAVAAEMAKESIVAKADETQHPQHPGTRGTHGTYGTVRHLRHPRHPRHRYSNDPNGLAFADPSVTASCTA